MLRRSVDIKREPRKNATGHFEGVCKMINDDVEKDWMNGGVMEEED